MRILIAHNHYGRYAQGGEANVVDAEAQLLERQGHSVKKYERTNAEVYSDGTIYDKIEAFQNVAWSKKSYTDIQRVIKEFLPDILHVHNYKFVLTPSIFAAAKDAGVATVLTLHNYRMVCPGGQFLRNNMPCELCIKGNPWRFLLYRCASEKSLMRTFLQLRLYLGTRKRSHLSRWVDAYIALTEFGRVKFIEGGLPSNKIYVKPNFIIDPLKDKVGISDGYGAIFVGRVSHEKGIHTLLQAWKALDYPLTIVGDGPLMNIAKETSSRAVHFVGWKSNKDTISLVQKGSFLVFPSICYEGFPLTLVEAMALGKPIIAADLYPRREVIKDGKTGLLFRADDPSDMAEKARMLIENKQLCHNMGESARAQYLNSYSEERSYKTLISIYEKIK